LSDETFRFILLSKNFIAFGPLIALLHIMLILSILLILVVGEIVYCNAFISPHTSSIISQQQQSSSTQLYQMNGSPDAPKTIEEDAVLQWDLFTKHHAIEGKEWWGTWSTYNYMGDLEDTSIAG